MVLKKRKILLALVLLNFFAFAVPVAQAAYTGGNLYFSPASAAPNTVVYLKSYLDYRALVGISYEYYDELIDGRLATPTVTSASFDYSLVKEVYNSYLGRAAWRVRGSFWLFGSARHYINLRTSASSRGSYVAKLGGGPGYIPTPYPLSAYLYVN